MNRNIDESVVGEIFRLCDGNELIVTESEDSATIVAEISDSAFYLIIQVDVEYFGRFTRVMARVNWEDHQCGDRRETVLREEGPTVKVYDFLEKVYDFIN
jgi:hypothetical protein